MDYLTKISSQNFSYFSLVQHYTKLEFASTPWNSLKAALQGSFWTVMDDNLKVLCRPVPSQPLFYPRLWVLINPRLTRESEQHTKGFLDKFSSRILQRFFYILDF